MSKFVECLFTTLLLRLEDTQDFETDVVMGLVMTFPYVLLNVGTKLRHDTTYSITACTEGMSVIANDIGEEEGMRKSTVLKSNFAKTREASSAIGYIIRKDVEFLLSVSRNLSVVTSITI